MQRMWCWESRKEQREQPILQIVRGEPQAAGRTRGKEPAAQHPEERHAREQSKCHGGEVLEEYVCQGPLEEPQTTGRRD